MSEVGDWLNAYPRTERELHAVDGHQLDLVRQDYGLSKSIVDALDATIPGMDPAAVKGLLEAARLGKEGDTLVAEYLLAVGHESGVEPGMRPVQVALLGKEIVVASIEERGVSGTIETMAQFAAWTALRSENAAVNS